jgi:hypothetical protein
MKYVHEIPVAGTQCYLAYGGSSWDGTTPVVKLGWRDVNGKRVRPGGELWMGVLCQAVTEAIRLGYLTPKQALKAVTDGLS